MNRSPEQLPDLWLFDSEALLRELDRCRELILQIPITSPNATHFGINIAVDAIWNLRENLRHLLLLHREGQRAFRREQERQLQQALSQSTDNTSRTTSKNNHNILHLQASHASVPRKTHLRRTHTQKSSVRGHWRPPKAQSASGHQA